MAAVPELPAVGESAQTCRELFPEVKQRHPGTKSEACARQSVLGRLELQKARAHGRFARPCPALGRRAPSAPASACTSSSQGSLPAVAPRGWEVAGKAPGPQGASSR